MQLATRNILGIGVGLLAALLVVIATIGYRQINELYDQSQWVSHTLQVENALGRGYIVVKRTQGFLHHGDVIAVLGQDVVDGLPTRPVYPGAMHQDDILDGCVFRLGVLRHRAG